MKNLLYKEFKLSIHKFFYLFPFLLALLMFIPQWFFILVFMYFFWISVPQIYGSYNAQNDYLFTHSLPISKKSIVLSKAMSLLILELLHFIPALIVAFIHNRIYGSFNFGLDLNMAFFGVILILFSLFNIVFLPSYFKTAFHFGKPLIYGSVVTLLYGAAIEFSNMYYLQVNNLLEGSDNIIWQFLILVIGVIIFIVLNLITINQSIKNYSKVN